VSEAALHHSLASHKLLVLINLLLVLPWVCLPRNRKTPSRPSTPIRRVSAQLNALSQIGLIDFQENSIQPVPPKPTKSRSWIQCLMLQMKQASMFISISGVKKASTLLLAEQYARRVRLRPSLQTRTHSACRPMTVTRREPPSLTTVRNWYSICAFTGIRAVKSVLLLRGLLRTSKVVRQHRRSGDAWTFKNAIISFLLAFLSCFSYSLLTLPDTRLLDSYGMPRLGKAGDVCLVDEL